MKILKFEDIIAWQKAQDLAVNIYQKFSSNKDLDFCRQIKKASISVSNNIAEGFDRDSDADFKRFLNISKASNSEVKSMLYLASRLKMITDEERIILQEQTNEIAKLLRGFIKTLTIK